MNKIPINNKTYTAIDSIEKVTMADSFVVRSNKIQSGNGEAKLYVGQNSDFIRDFFGSMGFSCQCIMLKKDLISYLSSVEYEYKNPSQQYRDKNNLQLLWQERYNNLTLLPEYLYFQVKEQSQITGPRIYIKSEEDPFQALRTLSLPNITYLSIIKLKEDGTNNFLFYFRLLALEEAITIPQQIERAKRVENEINDNTTVSIVERQQLIKARVGQGKYRLQLLQDCPFCPITGVKDSRLLVASHIKPWVDSSNLEKLDNKNGFMFTPTIDLLFDRGYITFSDSKEMLISSLLSKETLTCLNLTPNKKYPLLPINGREMYLAYHQEKVFKGFPY